MSVKFHGCQSKPRTLNGGGPQGATFGILEYLSQSNHNADFLNSSEKYKFIDDLTILEIINLITVGLSSFNVKETIPSDLPEHNQYIPSKNLKSQQNIDNICEWTHNQKILLNEEKSKVKMFNFTNNYQFTTRLKMENNNLEIIKSTKLLGTIIQDDLKWDKNTD